MCDFGLARPLRSTSAEANKQVPTNDIKPVLACAPESLANTNIYSLKTDVFMFGCTLWEIPLRKPPFAWLQDMKQAPDATISTLKKVPYDFKFAIPQTDIFKARQAFRTQNKDTSSLFYEAGLQYIQQNFPASVISLMLQCSQDGPDKRPNKKQVEQIFSKRCAYHHRKYG